MVNQDSLFGGAAESTGLSISANRAAWHPLSLTSVVSGRCLRFVLSVDQSRYGEAAIGQLMDHYQQAMTDIIQHCVAVERAVLTPSDFPLAQVSTAQLMQWQMPELDAVEDLYPATGMQQGMLFHSQLVPGSYVLQTLLHFESLDSDWFMAAWEQVIKRHQIFRTSFVGMAAGNAHQLIRAEARLPWIRHDLTGLT